MERRQPLYSARESQERLRDDAATGGGSVFFENKSVTTRYDVRRIVRDMFLPSGYPTSVSPDYTAYQVFNALQAFCSSVAGLIASRAVLEGFGVGDASASATHAMVLTVIQDVFSRLTTILGAYALGTSLWPEAKMYRLLADILYDAAIILDTLSPAIRAIAVDAGLPPAIGSDIRLTALCMSGAFRALCGIAAGGSKAALTLHFASGGTGTGDVGDLNAKDGSKETVLALIGLLAGTFLLPHLVTPGSTYGGLLLILGLHLLFNYLAVRTVTMRSFSRQRLSLAWSTYIRERHAGQEQLIKALKPERIALCEHIFHRPFNLLSTDHDRVLGRCTFESSAPAVLQQYKLDTTSKPGVASAELSTRDLRDIRNFDDERFIVWFNASKSTKTFVRLYTTFKPGYTPIDGLKAWVVATETARRYALRGGCDDLHAAFPDFLKAATAAGWRVDNGLLMPGNPEPVVIWFGDAAGETRKSR